MKIQSPLFRTILIISSMLTASLNSAFAESTLKPTFNTIFQPLQADPMEPRIAVMPWLDRKNLQLDIGTSADIYQNENRTFSAGIDFGTWSLLKRSDNFKFPVDAIDYMFGVNLNWKKTLDRPVLAFDELGARFRLSHISAHFEDGHYDEEADRWIREDSPFEIPFTYSREFIDLVLGLSSPDRRVYLGYQYMFHTIPGNINPHMLQAGAELGLPGDTYVAADFKLLPIWQENLHESRGHKGTWNLQAGIRLGSIGLDRVRIAYNYFSGMSRHGMYFYRPESFSTLGVIVDL
jgi:hypothetical protein